MRKLGVAIAVLGLLATLVGFRAEHWVVAALEPDGAFDAARTPSPPDYGDPAAWTAHPDRPGPADAVPVGLRAVEPERAPADVFYVHPTTYLGSGWNGPVDDPELNAQTDALATRIQASAFNGCCAVHGPRYRQAQGHAFIRSGPDGDAAIELAYRDVREAFRLFVEERSPGRPFLLAGHSQGSILAARLLREEIAGSALAERLVAAYLIGAPVHAAPAAEGAPPCAAPHDTGCLVAWNARGPRFAGSPIGFPLGEGLLCVNPLTWRRDEAPAAAELNRGAVFLHAGSGTPLPGFANARCLDGVLRVSQIGTPPRDLRSRVLDWLIGPQNYHPIEYQLYYVNLRDNARVRVAAYLAAAEAGDVQRSAGRAGADFRRVAK